MKLLQNLAERERVDPELQKFLTEAGYYGRTAKCLRCVLVGVQRPGWIQVFEIDLRAKRQEGDWEEKFALCLTDERDGTYQVQLFDDYQACREASQLSTQGMIVQGRGDSHPVKTLLMVLFVVALFLAVLGAVLALFGAVQPAEVVAKW
jgi:hypothetical protein